MRCPERLSRASYCPNTSLTSGPPRRAIVAVAISEVVAKLSDRGGAPAALYGRDGFARLERTLGRRLCPLSSKSDRQLIRVT